MSQYINNQIYQVILAHSKKMHREVTKYRKLNQQFSVDQLNELGRGNFGKVYKGYYKTQNKIIAAKLIPASRITSTACKRQLAIMQELAKYRHPNIMEYYGHFKTQQGIYLFVQYCAGGELKQLLGKSSETSTQYRKISQLQTIKMLKQILNAMIYIHNQNIVHRDLKPQNILLNQNNDIKIADFGLARGVSGDMTHGACTPIYAAPEVFLNQKYGPTVDVWSVGMILYQMLTGHQFCQDVKSRTELVRKLKKLQTVEKIVTFPKQIDTDWENIANYMLVYDSNKRPSFKDVYAKFKSLQNELTIRIIQKYGFEDDHFKNIDDGLRITNNVSPYQIGQSTNQSMEDKIRQQQSYTILNNFRKYLAYESLRAQLLLWIMKQFNKNQYNYIKNVNKVILIYLTTSAFIARTKMHRKKIMKQEIQLPDKKISKQDFIQKHLQQFKNLKADYETINRKIQHKYQLILSNQIKKRIDNKYLEKQQDKKCIEEVQKQIGSITENIKNTNQRIFLPEENYLEMYRKLINLQCIHISTDKLAKINYNDLKTYTVIRIVGQLDKHFQEKFYKNDHYLLSRRQEFENMNRQQILELVQKIN